MFRGHDPQLSIVMLRGRDFFMLTLFNWALCRPMITSSILKGFNQTHVQME